METFSVGAVYNADIDKEAAVHSLLGDIYFKDAGLGDSFHDYCARDARTGLAMYESTASTMRAVVFRSVAIDEEWGGVTPTPADDLPAHRRTLDNNAKGIGLYTASSPEGAEVFAREIGMEIGVYLTPDVRSLSFGDIRQGNPNSPVTAVKGILRHLGYKRAAKARRDEFAVACEIDNEYGDADVVLMNPAPTAHAKHVLRHGFPQFTPVWALMRNSVRLDRIGTANSFNG